MNFATCHSNRNKTGRIAMLVGCLLAGSLGVAQAATPSEDVPTVVVSYADLDVSTPEGARALYQRISVAAHKVCPFKDSVQPLRVAMNNACRAAAIERAVSSVNSTQLAAVRTEHVKRG
jgi:UrcA family protein